MKRLICELHGSSQPLAWDEMLIKNYIEPELDYTSPIIPFQLAANLGKRQVSQCQSVYSRYTLDLGPIKRRKQVRPLIFGASNVMSTTPNSAYMEFGYMYFFVIFWLYGLFP